VYQGLSIVVVVRATDDDGVATLGVLEALTAGARAMGPMIDPAMTIPRIHRLRAMRVFSVVTGLTVVTVREDTRWAPVAKRINARASCLPERRGGTRRR
jgi:hypothetical protein